MKILYFKLSLFLSLCFLFYYPFAGLGFENVSDINQQSLTLLTSNPEEWIANYGANSGSQGNKVAIDSEGNVYVAGWYYNKSTSPSYNATLWKFSSSGELLWIREWGGGSSDQAKSIYIDSQDYIYVTGYFNENPAYGKDIFIKKFSTSGVTISTYNISSSIADYANDIVVDQSGNIYITGYTDGLEGWTCYTAKLDGSGTILWNASYGQDGSENNDKGEGLIVDNDGNVFVCGYSTSYTNGKGPLFLKYNSSGFLIFNMTLTAMKWEFFDIDMNSRGDIYLIGYCDYNQDGTSDFLICKYSKDGLSLWNNAWSSELYDYGRALAIDSNDNVYAICDTGQGAGMALREIQIKKFSIDGILLYETTWTRGLTDNAVDAMLNTKTNDLFITGYSTAFSTSDIDSMILIKNPLLPDESNSETQGGENIGITLSISDILSIVNTGAIAIVIVAAALKLRK